MTQFSQRGSIRSLFYDVTFKDKRIHPDSEQICVSFSPVFKPSIIYFIYKQYNAQLKAVLRYFSPGDHTLNVKIGTLLKRSVDKYFVDFDQLNHDSFPLRLTLLCKKFAISKKVCLYGISVHKLMIVLKVFSSSKPKL